MMMADKKKGVATLILNKLKDGKEEVSEAPKNEMGDEMDQSAGKLAAAEEVMQSLESKDPKMLLSAIESLISMCMDEQEESEED